MLAIAIALGFVVCVRTDPRPRAPPVRAGSPGRPPPSVALTATWLPPGSFDCGGRGVLRRRYRHFVVQSLKKLAFLDSVPVTAEERGGAKSSFSAASRPPLKPIRSVFNDAMLKVGLFKPSVPEPSY